MKGKKAMVLKMLCTKKAHTIFFADNFAEMFFFILLVIGLLLSLSAPSAVITYALIFFIGMMCGRIMEDRKKKTVFPYYLMITGLLMGYLIGSYRGDRKIVLVLFILGWILSYYLHEKGLIKDIRM